MTILLRIFVTTNTTSYIIMRLRKHVSWIGALALLCGLTACKDNYAAIGSTEVLIETSEGDIRLRLYDDTPQHRDNFIRQVEAGAYNGILFNRIVPDMVIQAGDTTLKADGGRKAENEVTKPTAHTVPAEIVYPRHFHKQGALAMAREPDSINPGRASSDLQWYIVTGKKQTSAELAELYALLYEGKVQALFKQLQQEHAEELSQLLATDRIAQQELLNRLLVEAEETLAAHPPRPFNEQQKQTYARTGGAPHLDGEYTVFGEVVEGMPVALRIGRTPVDGKERPRKSVCIKRVTIKKK